MKPKYLELCGINSFSEPARVDFDSLLDQGIFGIFGDTGSGKSTILDCIGFALYGSVSRDGNSAELINFRCEKGSVVFVFEIFYQGIRRTFRVEREIKRKKDGSANQNLVIYEEQDGKLLTVEGGVREGNAFLQKVIGLKQDDFEKCIALPQGEFARFIKEPTRERLEIVSRLFDLERFGADLSRRASNRCAALTHESDLLTARLEQYADVSRETLVSVTEEIAERTKADEKIRADLNAKREEERKLNVLLERRKEFERVCIQKDALAQKSGEMAQLEGELSRLQTAKTVLSAESERLECEQRYVEAKRRSGLARERAERANGVLAALPAFDEKAAQAEIESLTLQRGKAELAFDAEKEKEAAQRELSVCEERYELLRQKTVDPDYDNKLKELLALQEKFGAGDLYEFLSSKRSALFRGEYERFASEIKTLQEKYPVILPDSAPLAERYTALSQGEKLDLSDLKEAFEARERAKRASEQARLDLESAQNAYLLNKSKLQALAEKNASLKEKIAGCEGRIAGAADLGTLERQIAEKKERRERILAAKSHAEQEKTAADLALASSAADESACCDALQKAEERLERLTEGNFSDVAEAKALLSRYGDAENAKLRLKDYKDRSAAVLSKYEELKADDYSKATEENLAARKEELFSLESARDENAGQLAVLTEREQRIRSMLSEKETLETEYKKKKKETEVAQSLLSLLRGGKFMDFVSEEYLHTVSLNASVRLLSLTGGRFFLRYKTGTGFGVGDNFNGGQLRAVSTLSGGETFLVSLSLALALSAEICNRSARPIEFFFLDEGFGTLDEKLVDTVMDSLEKLRSKSFSIGIISHVEELKHRIERKLLVTKATEEHGSRITSE